MKLINYINDLGSKLSSSKDIKEGFSSIEEELFQILPTLKRFGVFHGEKLISVSSSLTAIPLQNSLYKTTVNECLKEVDSSPLIVGLEHDFFIESHSQAILIRLNHKYKIVLERPVDEVNLTPIFELIQVELNKFILNRSQKRTRINYSKTLSSVVFLGLCICLSFLKIDRTEKAEFKYVASEKRGVYSLQEKAISEIRCIDGSLVQKGQVILKQKSDEFSLAIRNYESQIEELFIAQKEAEFKKEIAKAKILSLQIEQAEINKKDATRKLEECTIYASFSGRLKYLLPEKELLNSIHQRGTLLFEIFDDERSVLEILLPHQKASILKACKKVEYFDYNDPLVSKELNFSSLRTPRTPKFDTDLQSFYFVVESKKEENVAVGTRGKATFIAAEEAIYKLFLREIKIKLREYF